MAEAPTRGYRERIVGRDDRSWLRHEVLRSRGEKFSAMRKRYATMLLGASLAVGGVGIPMSASRMLQQTTHADAATPDARSTQTSGVNDQLGNDLAAAQDIVSEVAGKTVNAVNDGVSDALSAAPAPSPAAKNAKQLTEQMRREFFNQEVPFGSIIYQEAKNNGLSPELLAAVVKTESRFIPTARSGAGAQGLMQLVPRTGRWMGARNLMNPAENVRAGAKYLKYLSDRFDGDQNKVIAAYNAGEGNVRRFGGVPPFRETQNYVQRVMNSKQDFHEQVSGKMAEILDQATGVSPTDGSMLK